MIRDDSIAVECFMKKNVDIWQAFVVDAIPNEDRLMQTLSEEEVARGNRFVNRKHAQHFLLAHAILRDVLSRYVSSAPGEIVFAKGEHGKPFLADKNLEFNLTHSNDCILIAVSPKERVGVDVEFMQKTHRFDELVDRFFSDEEKEEYVAYDSEEERRLAFYRGWTRKEAYLKAMGVGLSFPLDQFAVSLAPDEKHALLHVDGDKNVRTKWTLLSFEVDADYLASFAIESPAEDFKIHTWSL